MGQIIEGAEATSSTSHNPNIRLQKSHKRNSAKKLTNQPTLQNASGRKYYNHDQEMSCSSSESYELISLAKISLGQSAKKYNNTNNTTHDTPDTTANIPKLSRPPQVADMQLYVLLHGDNKYYVGVTNNFDRRLQEHHSLKGARWTKIHQPIIRVVKLVPLQHKLDEDNMVKQLMMEYGIDNVRGGSYSQIKLTPAQLSALQLEFNHAENKCFSCGRSGHYAKQCMASRQCARCNRYGHMIDHCFAKTNITGKEIPSNISTELEKIINQILPGLPGLTS